MTSVPAAADLTLTRITSPSFGTILSGGSGRQFVLNSDGTVSGSSAGDYVGGAAAGEFRVNDTSSPQTISIVVDNVSTQGGLTVVSVSCAYNGAAQQQCDGSGISVSSVSEATLRLGLEVSTSTVHGDGDTASVSMDVSIAYL